ncbi:MAG: ATP-binding protein [Bacteroidota bacterium]
MRETFRICIILLLFTIHVNAQDFLSDSIRTVIAKTNNDSIKASSFIALARHQGSDLRNVDIAIVTLNNALAFARQKMLVNQEIETIRNLGGYYSAPGYAKHDFAKGRALLLQAIALARKFSLKEKEIDLLTDLSMVSSVKPDSIKLLIAQSLSMSIQYQLVEKQIRTLLRKANYYVILKSDSARLFFAEALSLSRQSSLPKSEVDVLQAMAVVYSNNHKSDSSNYLRLQALKIARENNLARQEVTLLRGCISTRGTAFFIKDSLDPYYERCLFLLRQLHEDSLSLMSSFATACMDIVNYPKALQVYFSALHASKERKDSANIEEILDKIGNLFQAVKDYKKSIAYCREAITYGSKSQFYFLFSHIDMAVAFVELEQKDSARYFADKSYNLAKDLYGENIYGGVLNTLGRVYTKLGDDNKALDYLRRSYVYFTKIASDYNNYCESTIGLATYFKKAGIPDSVLLYAKLGLRTAQANDFSGSVSEASNLITEYYQNKHNADSALFYQQINFEAYKKLYNDESSRQFQNFFFAEQQREADIAEAKRIAADQYAGKLRLYGMITIVIVALVIGIIVFRNNIKKQKSFDLLKKQKQEIDLQKSKLEVSITELQTTQSQLIQSEKMASLGELTAGIAHEIQNPLNFVNNFSELNNELIEEMKAELVTGNLQQATEIADDIKQNLEKINHHGKRADAIVKGMLQHSRSSNGVKEPTDINALADEYLRLAYHGLRAKDKLFNATMKTDFDESIGNINIIPQDMGRVILNLITNAFYVVNEKSKQNIAGYEPTVTITTASSQPPSGGRSIIIKVSDNGGGIPQKILDKIFQPFFTTKPTGQGTGLGLSLSYDIVKAHGGELKVETKEGEGTIFIIQLQTA